MLLKETYLYIYSIRTTTFLFAEQKRSFPPTGRKKSLFVNLTGLKNFIFNFTREEK